jgi:hypothetical protein
LCFRFTFDEKARRSLLRRVSLLNPMQVGRYADLLHPLCCTRSAAPALLNRPLASVALIRRPDCCRAQRAS